MHTNPDLKLTVPAREYQLALDAQCACNLSGAVHAMSRAVTLIWEEAHENKLGTEYVNTHPICVLYAEQIAFLTGKDVQYEKALGICTARAAAVGAEMAQVEEPVAESAGEVMSQ